MLGGNEPWRYEYLVWMFTVEIAKVTFYIYEGNDSFVLYRPLRFSAWGDDSTITNGKEGGHSQAAITPTNLLPHLRSSACCEKILCRRALGDHRPPRTISSAWGEDSTIADGKEDGHYLQADIIPNNTIRVYNTKYQRIYDQVPA
jgi:hypothetical protein